MKKTFKDLQPGEAFLADLGYGGVTQNTPVVAKSVSIGKDVFCDKEQVNVITTDGIDLVFEPDRVIEYPETAEQAPLAKFAGYVFTVNEDPDYHGFFSVYGDRGGSGFEAAGKIGERAIADTIALWLNAACNSAANQLPPARPTPPVIPPELDWSPERSAEAMKQGWDVFSTGEPNWFQLEKIDDPESDLPEGQTYDGPRFERDDDAAAHVRHHAETGDPTCRAAIEFLIAAGSPDAQRFNLKKTW